MEYGLTEGYGIIQDGRQIAIIGFFWKQGRVVRKPVNVNPGLKVNWSIMFSSLKMFFTSNVWWSLRLIQLRIVGQTM